MRRFYLKHKGKITICKTDTKITLPASQCLPPQGLFPRVIKLFCLEQKAVCFLLHLMQDAVTFLPMLEAPARLFADWTGKHSLPSLSWTWSFCGHQNLHLKELLQNKQCIMLDRMYEKKQNHYLSPTIQNKCSHNLNKIAIRLTR